MRNIKCSDCAEYRNEWCEKIVDSPYPDMLRDCQYWHERKDMVEVIRCKDCKHWEKTWTNDWAKDYHYCPMVDGVRKANFYCADAEGRSE